MADEDLSLDDVNEDATDGSGESESKGSKKKLIIIIAAVSILLIGIGVAAYFLLFADSDEPTTPVTESEVTVSDGKDENETLDDEPVVEVVQELPKGEAIYISIPDPFLVNVKSGKRSRMMQIKVQLLVRSKEAEDRVKQHLPLIRNNMLDYFSLADANEVRTREGRKALKEGALLTAQSVMKQLVGAESIEMVLFTGFVIQ